MTKLVLLVLLLVTVVGSGMSMQQVFASESSPYDSGYDHGCDDAGLSESDKYINEPEKGPSFHTDEFRDGYYAGLNSCSSSSERGGGGNGEEDTQGDSPSQSSQSGTWTLYVDLSSSSFGSDRVCANVEGFYGFGPVQQCTNPGSNAEVSFDVPNSETSYKVCTWGGIISALLSNCHNYDNPGLDDQRITGQAVGG
ncbi:MAG: hypothetical protein ACRD5J_14310 [Nitrososphaeraceae archaeon]